MMRALLFALLVFAIAPAQAHKPSDSYLALSVNGTVIDGQWDIALRDLDFALSLDQDGNGELTWDEIRSQHGAIADYALGHLGLATDAGSCTVTPGEQLVDNHTDGAYTVLRFKAVCPDKAAALTVGYRLFADLDPQHKGLLKLSAGGLTSTAIFSPDNARQSWRR
jgi:hypothetical protein